MFVVAGLLLLLPALLVALQLRSALGTWRHAARGAVVVVLLLGSAGGALEWSQRQEPPPPDDLSTLDPVSSQACFKCHPSHYASWQRTFHRTMTREATPEYVKADFDGAVHHYLGVTSRMTRRGDRFFMETIDPQWEWQLASRGVARDQAGPAPRHTFAVDRVVGSHWFQQFLYRDESGAYLRLPLVYHLVEQRWIHLDGAFLQPEQPQFFADRTVWNETCVYCHNTRPSMNRREVAGDRPTYRTQVGELGIACEACHGAGERHVQAHHDPARRFAQHWSGEPDPTIVNPARLTVARATDVCAHCHARKLWRPGMWDLNSGTDRFLAGGDLTRYFSLFWSEAEKQRQLRQQGWGGLAARPEGPEPPDPLFWGDGTPLTTGMEYYGMALSACYQDGHGQLSCLSCHAMHQSDPNHQVKDGMRTNAACYACHESYRERLVEHTHHAADSAGSLCYNCHMPYQVYSLLTTHRSHRIAVPRVRDSLGTGKPHACNLCHLDKSLGWTQDQLGRWYGTQPEPLSDDDRAIASSVLHLTQSDARTRAVAAGAFGWPPAQQASGRDWPALMLTHTLEHERYQAVRYVAHKSLRSLYGRSADDYDFQGSSAERAAQLRALRRALEGGARPDRGHYPYLPLTAGGLFADDVMERLLRARNDPDVRINE